MTTPSTAAARRTMRVFFMVSKKALAVQSIRTASTLSYTRNINVNTTDVPGQAVLEGYFLFSGKTNGLGIELTNASNAIVGGIALSSTAYSYYQSGSYTSSGNKAVEEGVWQKFRVLFKPSTGRLIFMEAFGNFHFFQAGPRADFKRDNIA